MLGLVLSFCDAGAPFPTAGLLRQSRGCVRFPCRQVALRADRSRQGVTKGQKFQSGYSKSGFFSRHFDPFLSLSLTPSWPGSAFKSWAPCHLDQLFGFTSKKYKKNALKVAISSSKGLQVHQPPCKPLPFSFFVPKRSSSSKKGRPRPKTDTRL